MTTKYVLLVVGLLVIPALSSAVEPQSSEYYWNELDRMSGPSSTERRVRELEQREQDRQSEAAYAARAQEEAQRRETFERSMPVIVNGPGGARMYYPNGDGTFYQTYDR